MASVEAELQEVPGTRHVTVEGYEVTREDVAALSPYLTRHIKRFGDYFLDFGNVPQPLATELSVPV